MKMIGEIRVNIVGTMDPMLSISDRANNMMIEFFGYEISELRNWLNEQEQAYLPSDAEFQPRFTPAEFEEILAFNTPFEDDVADEM